MTTISARGWRRREPGLISAIEQPSLLPRAVELLRAEGIDEGQLIGQCRVPSTLFHTVTARTPIVIDADSGGVDNVRQQAQVVSLLGHRAQCSGGGT